MRIRFVLLLASSLAMVSCGTTTIEKPIPTHTEPAAPPADLGLALYKPRSDVADLTNAVRHVLNPADIYGGAVSKVATDYRAQPARYDAVKTTVRKVDEPIVIAKLDKVHDPVYEAWRKYCDNAENMTQKDWDIIDDSQMPAELEAIWADECVPLK
jgi:hypothetical protein